MKWTVVVLIVMSWALGQIAWAETTVYEWVDEQGVSHYSDTPPEDGSASIRPIPGTCQLKQQYRDKQMLEAVVIIGWSLGGLDESNRALAATRLRDKRQSIEMPLHDLEEHCKGGHQMACACLRSIPDRQGQRGFAPPER